MVSASPPPHNNSGNANHQYISDEGIPDTNSNTQKKENILNVSKVPNIPNNMFFPALSNLAIVPPIIIIPRIIKNK